MSRRDQRSNQRGDKTLTVVVIFLAIVSVSNVILCHIQLDDTHYVEENLIHTGKHHNSLSSSLMSNFVIDKGNSISSSAIVGDMNQLDDEESSPTMTKNQSQQQQQQQQQHKVAGLSCKDHGGPSDDIANEMMYWRDIETDNENKSPFYDEDKYVTFEPDHGGFNNIRMAMETILVLAHAMGRTLVLPPKKKMYLLGNGKKHQNEVDFNDFFHLDMIAMEHQGLNIITMEEFLERKGMSGELKSIVSGQPITPPNGITDWNGKDQTKLFNYLETVGHYPEGWDPHECVAAIPASSDPKDVETLQYMFDEYIQNGHYPDPGKGDFDGQPTPVDAPANERLKEMMATRTNLCIYDTQLQQKKLIHFKIDHKVKARMLTHFYAFIFFQDWKQDLWSKRFVRDHVRYIDDIVCAAARIVNAVREKAKAISTTNTAGQYNSFHVRRGDFQYTKVKIDIDRIYDQSKDELEEGSLLYIATDEKDKSFFDPLKSHYTITFLDDYKDLLNGVNPNYYGMLDQLVAYKGEIFFGTWFSTLSGFINRMRGYYSTKHKLEGYEDGIIKSYYFTPTEKKDQMLKYRAVKLPIYMREFPVSWRDIDKGVSNIMT